MKNKITVGVEKVDENTMFLTEHLGKGDMGEIKFDASFILPQMSLLVTINDNKIPRPVKYKINQADIIQAIIEQHKNIK